MTKHIWANSIEEAALSILDNYKDLSEKMMIAMNDMDKPLPPEVLVQSLNTTMENIIQAVNNDSRMVFLPNGDIWLPPTLEEK